MDTTKASIAGRKTTWCARANGAGAACTGGGVTRPLRASGGKSVQDGAATNASVRYPPAQPHPYVGDQWFCPTGLAQSHQSGLRAWG